MTNREIREINRRLSDYLATREGKRVLYKVVRLNNGRYRCVNGHEWSPRRHANGLRQMPDGRYECGRCADIRRSKLRRYRRHAWLVGDWPEERMELRRQGWR